MADEESKGQERRTNVAVEDDDDQALPEWDFPAIPWDINLQTKRHKAVYLLSKVFAGCLPPLFSLTDVFAPKAKF